MLKYAIYAYDIKKYTRIPSETDKLCCISPNVKKLINKIMKELKYLSFGKGKNSVSSSRTSSATGT